MSTPNTDHHSLTTYTFCGRFFAALEGQGVTHVVASPGSRSTPLVVSARLSSLKLWMHLDERSAGFFALGLARATQKPVVLVCTSGTAAANYLPAVIEANHSGVPLIVCTADRPPELRKWGAGQTVDQVNMYGNNVRWFAELPVGSEAPAALGTTTAVRSVEQAMGQVPGPVHLNWPFRKPLEPPADWQVDPSWPAPVRRVSTTVDSGLLAQLAQEHTQGLIIAGQSDLSANDAMAISAFSQASGWPIVAGPASQLRCGPHADVGHVRGTDIPNQMGAAQVVVHVGGNLVTKGVGQWLSAHPPEQFVLVNPGSDWVDPAMAVSHVVRGSLGSVFAAPHVSSQSLADNPWLQQWAHMGRPATSVAAMLGQLLPANATIMASNSMPIRDLDADLAVRSEPLRVVANRGASGIDGVSSTALGLAAAGDDPVLLFIGDIALLHDLGGLLHTNRFGLRLIVVLIDNDGGAIFEKLPINGHQHFDELFRTPHGTDFAAVANLAGFAHVPVAQLDGFPSALEQALAQPGSSLLHVTA